MKLLIALMAFVITLGMPACGQVQVKPGSELNGFLDNFDKDKRQKERQQQLERERLQRAQLPQQQFPKSLQERKAAIPIDSASVAPKPKPKPKKKAAQPKPPADEDQSAEKTAQQPAPQAPAADPWAIAPIQSK